MFLTTFFSRQVEVFKTFLNYSVEICATKKRVARKIKKKIVIITKNMKTVTDNNSSSQRRVAVPVMRGTAMESNSYWGFEYETSVCIRGPYTGVYKYIHLIYYYRSCYTRGVQRSIVGREISGRPPTGNRHVNVTQCVRRRDE